MADMKLRPGLVDPMADALEQLAELSAVWFEKHLAGKPVPTLRRALVMACRDVAALDLAKHVAFRQPELKEIPASAFGPRPIEARAAELRDAVAAAAQPMKEVGNPVEPDPTDADGFYPRGQGPKVDNDFPIIFLQRDGLMGRSRFGRVDWVRRGFPTDICGWKPVSLKAASQGGRHG